MQCSNCFGSFSPESQGFTLKTIHDCERSLYKPVFPLQDTSEKFLKQEKSDGMVQISNKNSYRLVDSPQKGLFQLIYAS